MSSAPPGASWRQADLATSFLQRREDFVPMLAVQEDIVRSLLTRRGREIRSFVDLGCGDGAMTELVLDAHPGAEGLMIDFSEPMLSRAGDRLGRFAGRWSTRQADLNDSSWQDGLAPGSQDLVVSSLAIHHLPAERKRSLFGEVFSVLTPGGAFVNLDYVLVEGPLAGLFDEFKFQALRPPEGADDDAEQAFVDEDDDDRPDTAEDQVAWLAQGGFEQAAIQFKWAEAAVMAGFKPGGKE